MWITLLIPFFLQAVCIAVDEAYFHYRRGLPKWERIGHPLDTFTVLICLGWLIFIPFSSSSLIGYILLSAFSCIFVTKDEFVHKKHCPASESWLHALLFTLHPLTLILLGLIWCHLGDVKLPPNLQTFLPPFNLRIFLWGEFLLMALFFFYQIVYWNFIWQEKPSTTPSMKT